MSRPWGMVWVNGHPPQPIARSRVLILSLSPSQLPVSWSSADLDPQPAALARVAELRSTLRQQPIGPEAAVCYGQLGAALAMLGRRVPALWAFLHQALCAGWDDADLAYREYHLLPTCAIEQQAHAHHQLALWLRDQGCWLGARVALEEAIALNPDAPTTWTALGDWWRDCPDPALEPERVDRALAAYLQALYRNPTYRRPYDHLFRLLQRAGRFEDALSCGRKWVPRSLVLADRQQVPPELPAATLDYCPIDPADRVQLRASRSPLGEPPHPDLCATEYEVDPTFVVTLPQGRAWTDHYTSAIFTETGALVQELSLGSVELVALSEQLPPPRRVAGTVALLSVAGGSMFCHWLLNLLSRLRLLADAGWTLDQFDYVAVNEQEYRYQTETLELLGISPQKLIISNPDDRHIVADRLVVPSRVDRATPWICDTLRQLFLRPAIIQSMAPHDRLYISRDWAKYRRVVDDRQLSDWLVRQHGFKIVLLESLSFAQQVSLLAQAKVVIAPHGAGLTNLVFCQPGTIVLELFSPRYVPSYFWEIADLIGLAHYHLVGEPLDHYPDPEAILNYRFSDPGADGIWIPFDRFQTAVNHLLTQG